MAISDSQKVDLLFKKLFGVTKTDLPANKSPSNESVASPTLNRSDTIWLQSNSIPVTAQSVSGVVQSYQTTAKIQCTADTTSTPVSGVYPTWNTGLTDWIPPEFGASYFVKVYADSSGVSDPSVTGTQLSDSGIAGVGEWNFDYQSGVLNFIGGTIPAALTSSNVVYVMGYRYVGAKGLNNLSNVGNLTIANTTISTNQTNGNITLTPTGSGLVQINSTGAFLIPTGNTSQTPVNPPTGSIRYNTDITSIEFFDGTNWIAGTQTITGQSVTPNGITNTFALEKPSTTYGVIVTLNGVLQAPVTSYQVSGSNLIFQEIPQSTDIISVRYITSGQTNGTLGSITYGTPSSSTDSGTKGDVKYDNLYLYVCVATDTWIRTSIDNSF